MSDYTSPGSKRHEFVTREEAYRNQPLTAEVWDVIERLLAERDAYREVAIKWRGIWNQDVMELLEKEKDKALIDAEAAKVLEGK